MTQSRRFDPDGDFIRQYLPQLAGLTGAAIHAPWLAKPDALARAGVVLAQNYPLPIVDHEAARARTLARFNALRADP